VVGARDERLAGVLLAAADHALREQAPEDGEVGDLGQDLAALLEVLLAAFAAAVERFDDAEAAFEAGLAVVVVGEATGGVAERPPESPEAVVDVVGDRRAGGTERVGGCAAPGRPWSAASRRPRISESSSTPITPRRNAVDSSDAMLGTRSRVCT
jgi:hypothetical protein